MSGTGKIDGQTVFAGKTGKTTKGGSLSLHHGDTEKTSQETTETKNHCRTTETQRSQRKKEQQKSSLYPGCLGGSWKKEHLRVFLCVLRVSVVEKKENISVVSPCPPCLCASVVD